MHIDNNPTSNPNTIANAFNNFFGNIAESTKAKISKTKKSPMSFLKNPNNHSIFFYATSSEEILNIIQSLDNNKSNGPNSIPTNIIKLIAPTLSPILSKLINLSYQKEIYPDCLKISTITPVYKKGSKLNVENYRSISLLSNINKIFEKEIR